MPDENSQLEELAKIRELIVELRDIEREQLEIYRQSVDSALDLQKKSVAVQRVLLGGLALFVMWFVWQSMT